MTPSFSLGNNPTVAACNETEKTKLTEQQAALSTTVSELSSVKTGIKLF